MVSRSEEQIAHYRVESFDEAVERLTLLRDTEHTAPARIEFDFPVENLPAELISEFCREAQAIGLQVSLAA
ncbi:MAG TPA: hypothetical protein VIS52_08435 [Motiliproteus sp.]